MDKHTSRHHNSSALLKHRKVRLTPQRAMILEVIAKSKGHINAEQILAKVKAKYANFNISTIYRNLEMLRDLGVLNEARIGQTVRYELASVPAHHHLVCKNCSKVIKADSGLLAGLDYQLKNLYGFKADLNHFLISGLCKNCQKISH